MEPPLVVGSPVRFVAGSYQGKTGIVQKLTPKKAHVESPDLEKLVCVMKASLQLNSPQQDPPTDPPE